MKHQGFTLLEVMLYVAIAATMFGAIYGLYMLSIQSRTRIVAITEVTAQSEQVMRAVGSELNEATAVNNLSSGQTSDNLNLTTSDGIVDFSLAGGQLVLTNGVGETSTLTDSAVVASNLQVTNLAQPGTKALVRVAFTLSSGTSNYDFVSSFGLK